VGQAGRVAITEYFERWLDAWEFRMEPEEIMVALDRGRMFLSARYTGLVAASDAAIDGCFFQVIELEDDIFTRGKEFIEEADARAAFERTS
jgi:hypothetical protein